MFGGYDWISSASTQPIKLKPPRYNLLQIENYVLQKACIISNTISNYLDQRSSFLYLDESNQQLNLLQVL